MVLFIAHINKSKSVRGDSPRIIKPTVRGTLGAKRSQKTTGRIENLNSVVVTIRDDVLPDPVHRYPGEAIEFTLAAAVRSELLHEVPVAVEYLCNDSIVLHPPKYHRCFFKIYIYIYLDYLNTMVRAVGHYDGVVRANREASGPSKASGFAPPHPELEQLPPLQQVVTPPPIAVAFQYPFLNNPSSFFLFLFKNFLPLIVIYISCIIRVYIHYFLLNNDQV